MSRNKDRFSGRAPRVGLVFDERMCKHYAPAEEDHPESPDRIRVIWNLLNSSGLAKRCIILKAKDAEDNHLALVHTKKHISLIKNISSRSKRKRIAEKFDSIYFNEGSTEAACLAAGSVIEAAEKVAKGEIDSAFAIVRPPGHHAEEGEPMGFCLYNNVAIAASYLLNEKQELGINKILIVDWDVHHGNGTQKMFYKDPRVLVFSVHRHDFGTFYPTGDDGSYIMTGEGEGAGHNINVPWEHGKCGDADYLAVWDHILIPVAKEFKPDMIIISAGFDAAKGDPLGGCCVSPNGYSIMLNKLMEFGGGKIVVALEGGYNLNSTASSALACVEVLLHNEPPNVVSEAHPFASTWRMIQKVCGVLRPYWPVLARIDINHVTESDPVTSPHVPEEGAEKRKCSDGPSSEFPAPQKGSQIKIDQLPKPVHKMTPAECKAFLHARCSPEHMAMLGELSTEQFADDLCFYGAWVINFMSEAMSRLKSCGEKDAVLEELKSEVKEKDAELMKTRNLNGKLEAEKRELQQRLGNADKEKEVVRMKARAEGKEEGIKLCRERILRPF